MMIFCNLYSLKSDYLAIFGFGNSTPLLDNFKAVNGEIMALYGHFTAAINVLRGG